jgi:hypothetical protein
MAVHGKAGTGKTTLMQPAAALIRASGQRNSSQDGGQLEREPESAEPRAYCRRALFQYCGLRARQVLILLRSLGTQGRQGKCSLRPMPCPLTTTPARADAAPSHERAAKWSHKHR